MDKLWGNCAGDASTLGADKGDVAGFVNELRQQEVTPQVAKKIRYSAIDWRTTLHPAYEVSQRTRKRSRR